MRSHKGRKLLYSKGNCQANEETALRMGEKFTSYPSDRGLVSRTCKELENSEHQENK